MRTRITRLPGIGLDWILPPRILLGWLRLARKLRLGIGRLATLTELRLPSRLVLRASVLLASVLLPAVLLASVLLASVLLLRVLRLVLLVGVIPRLRSIPLRLAVPRLLRITRRRAVVGRRLLTVPLLPRVVPVGLPRRLTVWRLRWL